jgi:hypothetical protein
VNLSKSSDPKRLNNIYVANVSEQTAYVLTWKYSWTASGIVVRVPGYRSRGPGFDSRRYQIL